jgi:hypothetical protein
MGHRLLSVTEPRRRRRLVPGQQPWRAVARVRLGEGERHAVIARQQCQHGVVVQDVGRERALDWLAVGARAQRWRSGSSSHIALRLSVSRAGRWLRRQRGCCPPHKADGSPRLVVQGRRRADIAGAAS